MQGDCLLTQPAIFNMIDDGNASSWPYYHEQGGLVNRP